MLVLAKSPASPEMIEALKAEHQVVVEVTVKRYYILHKQEGMDALMNEWFVRYRGSSHAYRDSSLVGGADVVTEIKNLTTNQPIVITPAKS